MCAGFPIKSLFGLVPLIGTCECSDSLMTLKLWQTKYPSETDDYEHATNKEHLSGMLVIPFDIKDIWKDCKLRMLSAKLSQVSTKCQLNAIGNIAKTKFHTSFLEYNYHKQAIQLKCIPSLSAYNHSLCFKLYVYYFQGVAGVPFTN